MLFIFFFFLSFSFHSLVFLLFFVLCNCTQTHIHTSQRSNDKLITKKPENSEVLFFYKSQLERLRRRHAQAHIEHYRLTNNNKTSQQHQKLMILTFSCINNMQP